MAQSDSEKKEFGAYLRLLRTKYKLTIGVLEAYSDIDAGYISRLERGDVTGRFPRIDIAHRLAEAIGNFCTPQERWALLAKGGFLPIGWNEAHEIVATLLSSNIAPRDKAAFIAKIKNISQQMQINRSYNDDQSNRDSTPTEIMGSVQFSPEHKSLGAAPWNARGAR